MSDNILLLSVLLSVFSAVVFILTTISLAKYFAKNSLFIFFLFLCLIYTQVSPTITLVLEGLPGVSELGSEYLHIQVYFCLFFFLPLTLLYFLITKLSINSKNNSFNQGISTLMIEKSRAYIFSLSFCAFAFLYMFFLIKNNLLFSRIGSEYLAEKLVSLPTLDFTVIRLYQDTALFFIVVLYVAWYVTPKKKTIRHALGFSLLANFALWGLYIILNSRLSILTGAACFFGIWLILTKKDLKQLVLLNRVFIVGVVALYLAGVVINVRTIGFTGTIRPEFFYPQVNIFGDSQGFNRLNCVDLLARMNSEIERQGPAWGSAWGHVYWNFGRFIDPNGFDKFRLSLDTTSKTYLMRRYLNWDLPDYYSCTLTDYYGNFYILGLFFGALIYALLFSYIRKNLVHGLNPYLIIISIYMLTSALVFDQEASSLLFSWTKELPIIILVVLLAPFKTRFLRPVENRFIVSRGRFHE